MYIFTDIYLCNDIRIELHNSRVIKSIPHETIRIYFPILLCHEVRKKTFQEFDDIR